MIIGTICLVLGVVAIIVIAPAWIMAFKTYSFSALMLLLVCMVCLVFVLPLGIATYECAPDSPWFGFMGPCQGGVPWP